MSEFIGNLLNGAPGQGALDVALPPTTTLTTPTPQTSITLPDVTITAAAPIPVTPISQSSFKSQLAGFIAPNPLNPYFNPTYHFRLFMAGDKDLISQQGGAQTISDLLLKVNNQIDKVIIAETGVTGFNIREVQIDTVNAQTAQTRQQTATTLTMTIVEPLGISFLDGMAGAGQLLGVWDYTKMIYFLQLWFEGYTETGTPVTPIPHPPFQQPANSSTTRSNGGQWLWALKLTKVNTKVNEGGGVYTLDFISTESEPMFVEASAYAPKKAIMVSGATVADLLNNYAQALSTGSIEEQGKDAQNNGLIKFLIDSSQTIQFGVSVGKSPGQFKLQPSLPDYNSVRLRQQGTVYNMVVPAGTTLNDVIVSVVLSTEEGQAMFKDETVNQSDQITAKLYRTPVHISLEADVMVTNYDQGPTRNYQQTVTVHLIPHYSQTSVLSTIDLDNANNASAQRQRILELASLGFLRKQYDYLFTGLNTEVLEFDIAFNFAWQAVLPKQGGTHADYNTEATQCRLNRDINNMLPPLQTVATKSSTIGATAQTYYIEDILPQLNGQTNIGKVLPVSFVTTLYDTEREQGIGSQGQFHAAEPLASAIVSQKYYGAFMQIEISIRGDPYWLGQTNMERQVIFRNGGAAFDANSLSDFSSGNPTFVLNLKYPVTIGDDFVPILKDSAVFNGLYEVTRVKHTFSEGAFKQVLSANRLTQLDPSLAFMADTNALNSDTSSATTPQNTPSGAAGTPATGSTPGVSSSSPSLTPTSSTAQVAPTDLQSSDPTTIGNLSSDQLASLKAAIGQNESGNNPSQGNNGLGYIGQYQFGQSALIGTGYVVPGSGTANNPSSWVWTGQGGVNSESDFLSSPTAQNSAMNNLMTQNYNTMLNNGTINSSTPPSQVAGLLSAAQLAGAGGASAFAAGHGNPSDAFGTSTQKSYNLGFNSIGASV